MAVVIPFPGRQRLDAAVALRQALDRAGETALDLAEQVIAILDMMEDDPDLEDVGEREPKYVGPPHSESQVVWIRGTNLETE